MDAAEAEGGSVLPAVLSTRPTTNEGPGHFKKLLVAFFSHEGFLGQAFSATVAID
jgi:hypothetical protein